MRVTVFASNRFNAAAFANCTLGRLMNCLGKRLAQDDDWRDVAGGQPGPNRQAETNMAAVKCRELASPFLSLLPC